MATAEFSCDIYTDFSPLEGSEITFSEVTQTFYIASVNSSAGVCSVTAYDLCKNLDIPFDYSAYARLDGNGNEVRYPTSSVTSDLANQCGFTGGTVSGRVAELTFDSFSEKSCRQILDDLSVPNGGFWFDNNGTLAFRAFSPPRGGLDIPAENERTEIKIRGCKHISGVYIYDELGGGELISGANWKNTEKISGKFYSLENTAALAGQILGNGGYYDYYGWECSNMIAPMLYNLGDFVSYSEKNLPVLSADYQFTGAEIIACLSASEADSSFSEYQDLYSRKIAGCVAYDRVLGCTVTTKSGIGLCLKI